MLLTGYITVFIEPPYAWQKKSDLPPNLRDVLVNVHGVPDAKISEMTRRKENICPRYLQYVIKPSALFRDFLAGGISTEQLNPYSDAFAFGFGTFVNKSSDLKSAGRSLASASADIETSFLGVPLKAVLHVTTDYIGNDARLLSSSDHQEIVGDLLSSCKLQIVAIYADAKGVGALVTSQSRYENNEKISETNDEEKSEMKKKNWIDMIKNSDEVPRYQKYTKNKPLGNTQYSRSYGGRNRGYRGDSYQKPQEPNKVPHITISVNPTYRASMIGEAAYEFQQQLFKNNMITLSSKETSKTSDAVTAPSINEDDDIFFFPHIVKVGNFEAVLFENPVKFIGTYVGFYST